MYWFLVVRKDLNAQRGDLQVVKGLRIGAAPGPVDGLKQMLKRAGVTDVQIGPVPGAVGEKGVVRPDGGEKRWPKARLTAFGRTAWAPKWRCAKASAPWCSMRGATARPRSRAIPSLPSSAPTRRFRERPQVALAAILAVRAAHKALKEDPERATAIGKRLFPPTEAALIAELIRRDAPYYQHGISRQTVESMNRFAQDLGLLSQPVTYDQVVWTPD